MTIHSLQDLVANAKGVFDGNFSTLLSLFGNSSAEDVNYDAGKAIYYYAQSDGGNVLNQMLPFLLIFLVIYLIIIRPQAKRQQMAEWKKKSIITGDKIVTSGGVLAKVVGFRDEGKLVVIEVAKDVKVELLRAMVFDVFVDLDKKGNRVDGKTPPQVVPAAAAKGAKKVSDANKK